MGSTSFRSEALTQASTDQVSHPELDSRRYGDGRSGHRARARRACLGDSNEEELREKFRSFIGRAGETKTRPCRGELSSEAPEHPAGNLRCFMSGTSGVRIVIL